MEAICFCVTCYCLKHAQGFTAHISFDYPLDNAATTNITDGFSSEEELKWDIIPSAGNYDRIIPGFNGSSLQLNSGTNNCSYLRITPSRYTNIPTDWQTSAMIVSFWVYTGYTDNRDEKSTIMLASGNIWPQINICWFLYYEIHDGKISKLKSSMLGHDAKVLAYIYTYKTDDFLVNSWNHIILNIQQEPQVFEVFLNTKYLPFKRIKGSLLPCQSRENFEIDFRAPYESFNNCVTNLLFEDIRVSDKLSELEGSTMLERAKRNFCPQSTDLHTSGCVCWNGYKLETTSSPFCRNSKTCCIDENECNKIGICPTYSKCINSIGSYTCKSTLNHGICEQIERYKWDCHCEEGYEGEDCERLINHCKSYPCFNEATCKPIAKGYRCICTQDFVGKQCELSKLPVLLFAYPKRPHYTKESLTFLVYVNTTRYLACSSVSFLWKMGNGDNFNTSSFDLKWEGLKDYILISELQPDFPKKTTYIASLVYKYQLPGHFNGSISIYNSYLHIQTIDFHMDIIRHTVRCIPQITLHNLHPEDEDVMSLPRQKSALITSLVDISNECSTILGITHEWKAYHVLTNSNGRVINTEIKLQDFTQSNHSYLNIPKRKLPYGLIKFTLAVNVISLDYDRAEGSAQGFINITISEVVAVLVGGSSHTINENSDTIINASLSYNPDEESSNQFLRFQWFCWIQKSKREPIIEESEFCLGQNQPLNITDNYLRIKGKYLNNGKLYIVEVKVTSTNIKQGPGISRQILYATSSGPRLISILQENLIYFYANGISKCIKNCAKKANPLEKTVLMVTWPGYTEKQDTEINWTIENKAQEDIQLNPSTDMCMKQPNPTLCINPGIFKNKEEYLVKVIVNNEKSNDVGFASYQLEINQSPIAGICWASPNNGTSLIDPFNITCTGFHDEDHPLLYEFYQRNEEIKQDVLILQTRDPKVENALLATGNSKLNFLSELKVVVYDIYSASTEYRLNVTVHPLSYTVGTPLETMTVLKAMVSDTELEKNSVQLQQAFGDVAGGVQLASVLADALDFDKNSAKVNKIDTQKIRLTLTNILIKSPILNLASIKKASSVLEQLLNTTTLEMNEETQKSAVSFLQNLEISLNQIIKSEDSTVSQQWDINRSILRAISNMVSTRVKETDKESRLQILKPSDYEEKSYFEDYDSHMLSIVEGIKHEEEFEIELAQKLFKVIEQIASMLLEDSLPGEKESILEGNNMRIWTAKQKLEDLWDRPIGFREADNNEAFVILSPSDNTFQQFHNSVVDVHILQSKGNILLTQESSLDLNTPVINISLKTSEKSGVSNSKDTLDIQETVNIFFKREDNEIELVNGSLQVKSAENQTELDIAVHKLKITTKGTIILELIPQNNCSLKIAMVLHHRPTLKDFNTSYILPNMELENVNISLMDNVSKDTYPYTLVLPIKSEKETIETVYIGILPAENITCQVNSNISYKLQIFIGKCVYWDKTTNSWSMAGCMVGPLTSSSYLHCQCSHLSLFGASFLIAPNEIDPINDIQLFLKVVDNPVMLIVLLCVFLVYILLIPFARKLDRKRRQKGIIVLEDNSPTHNYFYLIMVATGFQRNSGTTSHVTIQLRGESSSSKVHVLAHYEVPALQRADVDTFLLATEKDLGKIKEIILFHDSYGTSPNWYLRHVVIYDVQKNKKWQFPIYKWLTVDQLPRNSIFSFSKNKTRPKEFSEAVFENLCDKHLLYSLLYRPINSNFTSFQRLSCLLCANLLSMLVSLMFYGIPTNKGSAQIDVGEFTFSLRQIVIGIEASIVIIPIMLIIILLFEKSRLKTSKALNVNSNEANSASTSIGSNGASTNNDKNISEKSAEAMDSPSVNDKHPVEKTTRILKINTWLNCSSLKVFFTGNYTLPHRCVYVAWVLLTVTCLISSFLIVLYGLRFGRVKSLNWLVSVVVSIVQGTFLQEPLSILMTTVIVVMLGKYFKAAKQAQTLQDKLILNVQKSKQESLMPEKSFKTQKWRYYHPLTYDQIKFLKERLHVEKQTAIRVLEIIAFCLFFSSLWVVISEIRSSNRYQETYSIKNMFVTNKYGDSERVNQLQNVNSIELLYDYLNDTVLPNLHESGWYNHSYRKAHSMVLADNMHILIGIARLRQLRVKNDNCQVPEEFRSEIKDCINSFDTCCEDDSSYGPQWISLNVSKLEHPTPWTYQRNEYILAEQFVGNQGIYPANSGFMADLGRTLENSRMILNYLYSQQWIDRYTRAILCEFTIYNVHSNYYSVIALLFEVSAAGDIITDYSTWSFRPIGYIQTINSVLLISSLTLAGLLISFLFTEGVKMFRQKLKYFCNVWNYLELVILLLCLLLFAFYIVYYKLVRKLVREIRTQKKNVFIPFYSVEIWDRTCNYTFALIVCLTMLKLWRLLTFNRHMHLFLITFKLSIVSLMDLAIIVGVVLMAFSYSSYLLFSPYDFEFHSFPRTILHFIRFSTGYTVLEPYININPTLGGAMFIAFVCIMGFCITNLFGGVLILGFRKAREKLREMKNEYELLNYINHKFKLCYGFCGGPRNTDAKRQAKWLQIEKELIALEKALDLLIQSKDIKSPNKK